MKRTLLTTALVLGIMGAGTAFASDDDRCDVKMVDWQPVEALQQKLEADGWKSLLDPAALASLPAELIRIAVVAFVTLMLLIVFWRPLKISTFDDDGGAYNQADAAGFIKLNALRLRIGANVQAARAASAKPARKTAGKTTGKAAAKPAAAKKAESKAKAPAAKKPASPSLAC